MLNFILGSVFSVLLCIVGNRLTRHYERWMEKRGIAKTQQGLARMLADYRTAKVIAERRNGLIEHFLVWGTVLMVWATTSLVFGIFMVTILILRSQPDRWASWGWLGEMLLKNASNPMKVVCAVVCTASYTVVIFTTMRLLDTARRVRHFDEYRAFVLARIPDADKTEEELLDDEYEVVSRTLDADKEGKQAS